MREYWFKGPIFWRGIVRRSPRSSVTIRARKEAPGRVPETIMGKILSTQVTRRYRTIY